MSELTDVFTGIASAIRSKTGSSSAFTPAQMITEIENIPTGGSWVGVSAYASSTITSYTGNENLILDTAFRNCTNLTTISFPNCSYIGVYAFAFCTSLTTASFPECRFIGGDAFRNCANLTTISFPNCSSIVSYAFFSCSALTTASFPECSYIGIAAFRSCANLTTASFPNCSYIGGSAFAYCTSLTTASFPECRFIGGETFAYCTSLTTASFPECSYIGGYAFNTCPNLSQLYLLSTSVVSLFDSNAFNKSPLSKGGTGTIYVPSSLYNTYITAAKWSNLSARLSGI